MSKVIPRRPSGFGELLPNEQLAFNGMVRTVRDTYERFGFSPIETPAVEYTEVLLAKGGGETDKQIYSFRKGENELSLHFDLTVPLARYVAEHRKELNFPFRRYQIQKVWRAEKAQKGRFREFYQCDIDVIGSNEIVVDAEIPSVIYSVFRALGFDSFTIKINNRKILRGFLRSLGLESYSSGILRGIDKVEKIGEQGVRAELIDLGVPSDAVERILAFVTIEGSRDVVIERLLGMGITDELFLSGVAELEAVGTYIRRFGVPEERFRFDLTIARGLDYYTGTVYETILDDFPRIGSVCSGGRYDDLIGYYSEQSLPGVGISIGLTRLFYQLKEAGRVDVSAQSPTKVLVTRMDEDLLGEYLNIASRFRERGIETEVYFREDRIGKQYKYADRMKVPFVITVGERECSNGTVNLKNMRTGMQSEMTLEEVITVVEQTIENEKGGHHD